METGMTPQQTREFIHREQRRLIEAAEGEGSGVVIHTMPIYEGMSIREAWQHTLDADGAQVPEFLTAMALGKRCAWVNVRSDGDELLGAYPAAAEDGDALMCDPDTLDEPWMP